MYRQEKNRLVSRADRPDLATTDPFDSLLSTLPDDCPIPTPIVKFGLLTQHLQPTSDDFEVRIDNATIESSCRATVPPKTLAAIEYFLYHHTDELSKADKRRIGRFCEVTELNRATQLGASDSAVKKAVEENDGHDDDILVRTTYRCEHCNDAFDSKAARNGHLATCDENPKLSESDTDRQSSSKSIKAKKFKGTVTQYLEQKGVGIVTPLDESSSRSNRTIRFHISDLNVDSVCEGDELKFSIRRTNDGFEARKPTLIQSASTTDDSQRPTTNPGSRSNAYSSSNKIKVRDCNGTVTTYFDEEGYGFLSTANITSKDGEGKFETTDVFFHISELGSNTVSEGDRLKFDVVETNDGLKAINSTVTGRNGTDSDGEIMRTDPGKRLGVSGSKDDTQHGRENPTTGGNINHTDNINNTKE